MVKVKVIRKTQKDLNRLIKQYMQQAQYVKVGILEAKTNRNADEPGGTLTNAQIARTNEYGHRKKGIPPRPFLRPTLERNRDKYIALFARIIKASTGNPALLGNAMGLIGATAQADVRKYITAGPQVPPPNAPRYLAYKRSLGKKKKGVKNDARTLVLTGQMVRAINYAVVKGKASPTGKRVVVGSQRYGGRP